MDKFLIKRKAPSQDASENINWKEEIQYDPGKRKLIEHYHPNLKDTVRRKYLVNGPCQPRNIDFPYLEFGNKRRRFNPDWFDEFGSWDRGHKKEAGYEAFVLNGWNSWNVKARLNNHVGDVNSIHNQAMRNCIDLLKRE
ncbi:hypothetical protein BRADI_2g07593v3 [Brachypodium distachyon]|uniref:Uncharacterized protein n=1 Tax=Brachypodium distachyon TaxID=15368 RepID=A0A2K2D7F0_BRADI|nr:hypothetical protein BRADI_2g07593v3 [Brachypodium distachyon]